MCIIAVKPAGVIIDDTAKEWLMNGACHNTHGAGLMYSDGSAVHFNKGWDCEDKSSGIKGYSNTIEGFIEYAASIPSEYEMVLHFRNASNPDTVEAKYTHPFPLQDCDALLDTEGKCEAAIVHNGYVGEFVPGRSDTDTVRLVQELNDRPVALDDVAKTLLKEFTVREESDAKDNKYAVMTPANLYVVGNFIVEDRGWLFSNDDYAG